MFSWSPNSLPLSGVSVNTGKYLLLSVLMIARSTDSASSVSTLYINTLNANSLCDSDYGLLLILADIRD
ncbi:MAG: hypothetical protein ACI9XK_003409 [Granulosicoccus sp.]|jgi:hypothetical protein